MDRNKNSGGSRQRLQQGMSLRDAIYSARELGVQVLPVRRTGEIRFLLPGLPPVTHNARRKCASRALVGMLRRVADL